jgi:hypothetical protein
MRDICDTGLPRRASGLLDGVEQGVERIALGDDRRRGEPNLTSWRIGGQAIGGRTAAGDALDNPPQSSRRWPWHASSAPTGEVKKGSRSMLPHDLNVGLCASDPHPTKV